MTSTPSRLAKEYVQEIPLDTKGFDNPIYASTPSPAKVGNSKFEKRYNVAN